MENFMPLRREFEEKRAILIAGSTEELRAELDRLFSTTKEREALGQRSAECFQEHLGAGSRCAEVLLETISLAEKRGLERQ
jgi:3-deoxy-D-manno-octulosonic-acid transferase